MDQLPGKKNPSEKPKNLTPKNSREPREESREVERTLITTQDYVDYYMTEGERLLRQGVEAIQPASSYVRAFPGLRHFLRQHGEVLAERGVVSSEIEAGDVLIGRLAEADRASKGAGPSGGRMEAIAEASGKLSQVRDSVRRLTRGAEGAEVRRCFGLDHKVDSASVASLLHGIELFLDGGRRMGGKLRSFRLIPGDLEQLEAHRERLSTIQSPVPEPAWEPQGDAQASLLAVENYFASLAAAITTAFSEGDPRRLTGLKLIPRHEERRQRVQSTRPLPRLWRPLMPTTDE